MGDEYCIDSSSLIEIKQRFPADVFVSLWQKVTDLVISERLIAPEEVLREIENDPQLGPWSKQHRVMFKKLDGAQIARAQEILARFSALVDHLKETADADPFIIALALARNQPPKGSQGSLLDQRRKCIVVTEERRGAVNIRTVCQQCQLQCLDHVGLFRNEGWRF